jgi:hypothetical protein
VPADAAKKGGAFAWFPSIFGLTGGTSAALVGGLAAGATAGGVAAGTNGDGDSDGDSSAASGGGEASPFRATRR